MSVADPSMPRTPPHGSEPPSSPRSERVARRIRARWDRRVTFGLLGLGALIVVAVFVVVQTYPNYDTYYTLVWGKELGNWQLPDYDVLRPPTPHPLSTLLAWALAPFGTASDRILVLASMFGLLAFYVVMFVFTERLLGRVIALIAVAWMLTRTDMQLLALRAMFDLPFYLMVFGAALLELRRPRCGWPVLLVLALAGLLRPEAWLLGGVYWLWLWRGHAQPRAALLRLLALVVAAPLIWIAWDLIVTGEPLYSFTSTREVSGEFGRNRGLFDAIVHIPRYAGGNDSIVTVIAGGLGLLVAVYILRRRALLPVALGALGVVTFLIIAAAGLSVIPRYLTIPSLLLSLCVAVALGGWTLIEERTPRRIAIGIAIFSVLLIGWRASYYRDDFAKLADQARFVEAQHKGLMRVLDQPRVVEALQSCPPVTVPTHSAIPVIRYETGLPDDALQASYAQKRAPRTGVLLVGRTYNFEPGTGRSLSAKPARVSVRKPWSNKRLPGFERAGRTATWTAYARCP
jgi:hypothetical protein